jgi:hypothetical protein
LSYWLRDVKLSKIQREKLDQKRRQAIRAGCEKRIFQTAKKIEEIQKASAADIKKIGKRELWLMGIVLYWRERFLHQNKSDLQKGVRFTSSDPKLIKLFLKWLKEAGGLKEDEIEFDIFVSKSKKKKISSIVGYWSEVTKTPSKNFLRVYFQKAKPKAGKRKTARKTSFGLLRVRVKASSMLARQISGWINGMARLVSK